MINAPEVGSRAVPASIRGIFGSTGAGLPLERGARRQRQTPASGVCARPSMRKLPAREKTRAHREAPRAYGWAISARGAVSP